MQSREHTLSSGDTRWARFPSFSSCVCVFLRKLLRNVGKANSLLTISCQNCRLNIFTLLFAATSSLLPLGILQSTLTPKQLPHTKENCKPGQSYMSLWGLQFRVRRWRNSCCTYLLDSSACWRRLRMVGVRMLQYPTMAVLTFKLGANVRQFFVYPLDFCLFAFTWRNRRKSGISIMADSEGARQPRNNFGGDTERDFHPLYFIRWWTIRLALKIPGGNSFACSSKADKQSYSCHSYNEYNDSQIIFWFSLLSINQCMTMVTKIYKCGSFLDTESTRSRRLDC